MRITRNSGCGIVQQAFPMLAGLQQYLIRLPDGSFFCWPKRGDAKPSGERSDTTRNQDLAAVFDSFSLEMAHKLATEHQGEIVPANGAFAKEREDTLPLSGMGAFSGIEFDDKLPLTRGGETQDTNVKIRAKVVDKRLIIDIYDMDMYASGNRWHLCEVDTQDVDENELERIEKKVRGMAIGRVSEYRDSLSGPWRNPRYRQEPEI